MPECKLGLNDRVLLEAQGRSTKGKAIDLDDIKFHQYVLLSMQSIIFSCDSLKKLYLVNCVSLLLVQQIMIVHFFP